MAYIFRFRFRKERREKQQPEFEAKGEKDAQKKDTRKKDIPPEISECEALVKGIFGNSSDLTNKIIETKKEKAMLFYIEPLVNKDLLDRDVILPLKSADFDGDVSSAIKTLYSENDSFSACVEEVLQGNVAIFYENSRKVWIVEFKKWDMRAVEQPDSETVIRGPKEGFNESVRTNVALIRRKIKTTELTFENFVLGRRTKTPVLLVYIKGIVNQDVLREVRKRLSQIDTGSILESGQIEQYIEDKPFSLVSAIGVTQKPDVLAARILEGRVGILCDGTPHALTIPELFVENVHTVEDYYNRTVYSSTIRILRIIGLFITVMLPGLAVAIMTYNQEMMPSVFLTNLISATEKTPMPAAAEIFLLVVMFELLKEAGTRLPKAVGSAITIVGSLIIGDAAVNAGIVGAPMVIIVALTAVTGFIVASLNEFTIAYRFFFLFMGSTMGLIGIGAGVIVMLTQLISTSSFGIPILSSFSKNEMKDTFVRFPLRLLKHRPSSIAKENIKRINDEEP